MKVKFNTVINNEVVNVEAKISSVAGLQIIKYEADSELLKTVEVRVDLDDMNKAELRDFVKTYF
jgi:hypothetical protein